VKNAKSCATRIQCNPVAIGGGKGCLVDEKGWGKGAKMKKVIQK
jgi:hypothetical protein